MNVEEFLVGNGFDLETYYGTSKRYRKAITECQTLYVRICGNSIWDVEYEHSDHSDDRMVHFETIDSCDKLRHLIAALS